MTKPLVDLLGREVKRGHIVAVANDLHQNILAVVVDIHYIDNMTFLSLEYVDYNPRLDGSNNILIEPFLKSVSRPIHSDSFVIIKNSDVLDSGKQQYQMLTNRSLELLHYR